MASLKDLIVMGPARFLDKLYGNLEGNATSADKLKTARNINGTSFDGSANITTTKWGTARTVTIGNYSLSVDGSLSKYEWSHNAIGVPRVETLTGLDSDYTYRIIPLCLLDNTDTGLDSFFMGHLFLKRCNLLSGYLTKINIICGKNYNETNPRYHINIEGGLESDWHPVTFTWNSKKYFGLYFTQQGAGYSGHCSATGHASDWNIIKVIDVYNTNTSTILNSEIYNSITILSEDTYTFPKTIISHVYPKTTNTFDLGSSNKTWRNVFANTLTGTLYGSATCVRDKTSNAATYLNYGASGLSTTSWFAAWNGYELRGISPINSRITMSALSATNANGYYGMGAPDGNTQNWIRTTEYGIIPYQSGGCSSLGTSSWPFINIYSNKGYFGGTSTTDYALNTTSFICDSWVRTKGASGWFNESYGGGWYMEDSTYIRAYNSKKIYVSNDSMNAIYTAGAMCAIKGFTVDETMSIRPERGNEINFGGNNTNTTIFMGYRAADSRSIPTNFVFGGNSGSATITASYFTGTAENAYKASKLSINNSASLADCLQYIQTSSQTSGNDLPSSSWWHVLKMNHGTGDAYYKRLLAFDFFSHKIKTNYAYGDGAVKSWHSVLDSETGVARAHYGTTDGGSAYILVTIKPTSEWMLNFTLRLYQSYVGTDIQISGYNYGAYYWHAPNAVILGSTSSAAQTIYFGYTSASNLWVAVPAGNYTGADVFGATNGYRQIDDLSEAFTITRVSSLPGTIQTTLTRYRPWYRDETVSNANTASKDASGNTITSSYLRRYGWWNSSSSNNVDNLRAGMTFAYNLHNAPTTGTIVAFDCSDNENYGLQIMGDYSHTVNHLHFRNRNGDVNGWGEWRTILDNNNYTSYTVTKTGSGASGTWGINITGSSTSCTGNAATATKLQTARTIFGHSFNGTSDVAGQVECYGSYTATASQRYYNCALEIRENGLVAGTQSDIGYAPSIGFHWGNRSAATLNYHSNGIFYFRQQDGVTRATIDANVNGWASSAGSASTAIKLVAATDLTFGANTFQYFNFSGTAGSVAEANDTPTSTWWHMQRHVHSNSTSHYYTDVAVPFNDPHMYYKRVVAGSLADGGWVMMYDTKNIVYSSIAPTIGLKAGMIWLKPV